MRAAFLIAVTCLVVAACGPANADSPRTAPQDDPGVIIFTGYQPIGANLSGFEYWAMRPDGTDLHRIAIEPDDDLSFSPGGDFIATWPFDGDLMFVSRTDGSEREVVKLPDEDGVARWPSVSGDGKRVAFVFANNPTFTGARNLWTVSVGEDDFKQVSSSGDVYRSAWSPDGEQIAFMDGDADAVYLVRPDGSDLRQVADGREPVWSPDGGRIALSAPDGGINIFDLKSGTEAVVTGDGRAPAWSPDGKQLAFLGDGKPCGHLLCNRVVILDLASGKTRKVGPQLAEAGYLAWTTARIPTYSDSKTNADG